VDFPGDHATTGPIGRTMLPLDEALRDIDSEETLLAACLQGSATMPRVELRPLAHRAA
jgi:hypothetical protein